MFADPSLSNNGEILVLFETPSGFAIFSLKEYYLNQPVLLALLFLPCSVTHVLACLSLSFSSA